MHIAVKEISMIFSFFFRTTILPQPEMLAVMLDKLKDFHTKFVAKYS